MELNKLMEKINEHKVSFTFQVLIWSVKFLFFKQPHYFEFIKFLNI